MTTPIAPTQPPFLGLYVHIPWCVKKCPYCDFNSHVHHTGALPETAYRKALLDDLRLDQPHTTGRAIRTIFFGGGTPSLFSADFFARFLQDIRHIVPVHAQVEVTLEANPGTLECAPFDALRQAGINRISLGLQSLNDARLQALGRIHSAQTGRQALDAALHAGFNSVNADLMFGLPGQSTSDALSELKQLAASGVPHLSWYQLTIEPNTVFFRQRPTLPLEDTVADIAEAGPAMLQQFNLTQYEVSAYAQAGHHCQHNRNYWEYGDYLGLGAGAHGKLTTQSGGILRTQRTRVPQHYLAHQAEQRRRITHVAAEDRLFEYSLNRLRLFETVSIETMSQATGTPLHTLQPILAQAKQNGWLSPASHSLADYHITPLGRAFLNDLTSLFLPE